MKNTLFRALKSYSLSTVIHKGFSIPISTHVIVSYQKSGKTWLRLMLAKILAETYHTEIRLDLERMTLWKWGAPKILISHAGSTMKESTINFLQLFRKKKIVLLVRDPRDMIVSIYHSAKNREKTYAGTLSEYICDNDYGILRIINFMNSWMEEMGKRKDDFLLVCYEDLQNDTLKELQRVVDFLGLTASPELLKQAVAYGSFDNMRKMETTGAIQDRRMKPIDSANVDSFKTRKGKVGSYKEEMSVDNIMYVDELMKTLDKGLGY